MSGMPWFRFYSEALSDRKLARVGRMSGLPRLTVMGAWATLLALANESPERGRLMVIKGQPLTDAEIRAEMELDEDDYQQLMDGFRSMGMIHRGNRDEWVITNWDKRNFESDNGTARSRRWRRAKRDAGEGSGWAEERGGVPEKRGDEALAVQADTPVPAPAQSASEGPANGTVGAPTDGASQEPGGAPPQQSAGAPLHGPGGAPLQGPGGATLHEYPMQRGCDGPDTDTETETETETDADTETEPDTETAKNAYADAGASPEEIPKTFQAWHRRITTSKNPNAKLREMIGVLFPGRSPPTYQYIGRVAKQVGGPGRLADLLWQAAARPPTGDLLRYCQAMTKGGNGRAQAPPDPAVVRARVRELLGAEDGE